MTATAAKVTVKGQVTVPQPVRKHLSIREGDKLLFIPDGRRIYIERLPASVPSSQVFGRLHRPGMKPLDIDQARRKMKITRTQRGARAKGTEQTHGSQ